MATLWELAERRNCVYCGRHLKVWNPSEALGKGESGTTSPYGPINEDYIDLNWVGYEGVCNRCRREDIEFRYRMSRQEYYESKNKPVPNWVWH